jgi:hypothetical protein
MYAALPLNTVGGVRMARFGSQTCEQIQHQIHDYSETPGGGPSRRIAYLDHAGACVL